MPTVRALGAKMPEQIKNLYRVQKKDITKAGAVLADAFQHDPFWIKLFEGEAKAKSDQIVGAFYESSIKYCLRYGEVYATSERLEGIVAWVPGDLVDMTIWRQIKSGAFITGMKAMMIMGARLGRKMGAMMRALEPVQAARIANMKGRPFIYLQILGVASELQGQGFGRKLLGALIEESEQVGVPIYTETSLEKALRVYKRFGFRLLNQITLPVYALPMWEMVREPGT
jgi:ribosomal protein S18 acetylase RimI-like enzyme